MSEFWNERYREKDYVYGEEPNVFFKEQIQKLTPGTVILPCEGEGRNAVYAASLGWQVHAFDSSAEGRRKALLLAEKKGQAIEYAAEDALTAHYPDESAEVVAFIYAHFVPQVRKHILPESVRWLKSGGRIILEGFNPLQLKNHSGGPKEPAMLYTEDMLREDFAGLKIEWLQSLQITLKEGKYHQGLADVVQFVGIKG
ncbi:MAG TPA: class I SAM-dependent methyltransferase [Saprospiraceae bacterium]|nr:class I SAM-dependent methyltransferase [Saprospiraceae bacterium]HNT22420.1 class I SAM-dependent methyltransferase [Saprospiraceae bacterium]